MAAALLRLQIVSLVNVGAQSDAVFSRNTNKLFMDLLEVLLQLLLSADRRSCCRCFSLLVVPAL
jgi:hypothetical protein